MKIKSDMWHVTSDKNRRPARRETFVTRHPSLATRHSEKGIALVITLILLSVTLFMAVAFLAISRRERGSVTTSVDTATARLAADSALANAQAQIIAGIFATTNSYNSSLLVSTNFINVNGFTNGVANPLNVNYDFVTGTGLPLNSGQFEQNVANLFLSPRPPVFITTNQQTGQTEFRFYLDLNRNGNFEDSGSSVPNVDIDLSGNPFTNGTISEIGDPQWIGVLERPDAPHGPNNKFLSRYAFVALPAGNSLDLNYIYNQAATRTVSPPIGSPDGYFRNQGVGSWEINLAAFLADLNTNQWNPPTILNPLLEPYQYPALVGGSVAFEDARALLAYRYNNNYNSLAFASTLLPSYPLNGPVDIFPFGPAMTNTTVPSYNLASLNFPWAGADNTNHFFDLTADLFDTTKITAPSLNFIDRLKQAGAGVSTYDRYTFYRLLAQLGTDSTPESGKMNLNYDNLDPSGNVIPGAETNLIPWTPIGFFTNAADRMLRLYTTEWFKTDPTNYLETYYGIVPTYYIDATGFGVTNVSAFGMTNQIPAFGVANIPVFVNGQFVYSSAVQRVLQLAANIYDATTNSAAVFGKDFPSVFRPLFSKDTLGNIFIIGYTNLNSTFGPNTVTGTNDTHLTAVFDVATIAALSGAFNLPAVDNIYGVPWIIGAKKGFPNFNEFSMNNVVQITRQLQIARPNTNFPPQFSYTNVTYVFGIGSSLGIEFWNSYATNYSNPVQIVINDTLSMALTNGSPFTRASFTITNFFPIFTNVNVVNWSNSAQPSSFVFQMTNVTFMTNLAYQFQNPVGPFLSEATAGWETNVQNLPLLPQLGLTTANRLQAFALDGNHVIDYVQFGGPNGNRNVNTEVQSLGSAMSYANMWTTNLNPRGVPYAIINQIAASRDDPNLPIGPNSSYWKTMPQNFEIDGFNAFMGGTGLPLPLGTASATNAFNAYLAVLIHQVPYTPTVTVYDYTTWQANDPLVHYLGSDLNFSELDASPPTGLSLPNYIPSVQFFGILSNSPATIGQWNRPRYQPWGLVYKSTGSANNPYDSTLKDPLVAQSDNWDFPTYKFPTVGWLGRVHRGTPWQTVYLKATNVLSADGLATWTNWTGNFNTNDAINAGPVQDRLLFDMFTTALNENATRGQLSINVGAGSSDPAASLAAWSALFSGIVVPPISSTSTYSVISPAGAAGVPVPAVWPGPNSPLDLGYIVQNGTNGINDIRTNFLNPDGLKGVFEHVGDILSVPALTQQSPFLNLANTNYNNDEMYEWLPQQVMSLLTVSSTPRYVIYSYGQTLKPAPNGIDTSSSTGIFGMVTNYQVVSEIATRAVVRVNTVVNTNSSGTMTTNYSTTVEQFNVLPPD
jgi:hypothetical protein